MRLRQLAALRQREADGDPTLLRCARCGVTLAEHSGECLPPRPPVSPPSTVEVSVRDRRSEPGPRRRTHSGLGIAG